MKVPLCRDGEWTDPRVDPRYERLLRSTAWLWVAAIDSIRAAPPELVGTRELRRAYYRLIVALPQLPAEGSNNDMRFHHARWRHVDVLPGSDRAHCEHPWSRSGTKDIVWNTVVAGRERGISTDDLVAAVGRVLAGRLDTLLLPSMNIRDHGVIPETRADGLVERYRAPIEAGLIVDRSTGCTLTWDAALADEATRLAVVESTAELVGLAPVELRRRHRWTRAKA